MHRGREGVFAIIFYVRRENPSRKNIFFFENVKIEELRVREVFFFKKKRNRTASITYNTSKLKKIFLGDT